MILSDVIRYYELTSCDFFTDLENFAQLQQEFNLDLIPDDFTEQYESFTDKLFILWVDTNGGIKSIQKNGLDLPNTDELIEKYCRTIEAQNTDVKTEGASFMKDMSLRKSNSKKGNKTLELVSGLTNADINITQFMAMEVEVIFSILESVKAKKKEEERKRKQKRKV